MSKNSRTDRALELISHDRAFLSQSTLIAGMDEAGRGPLAGCVVAACVAFSLEEDPILWVDDSKKLSESRREKVYDEIMEKALYVGIGIASAQVIDEINILQATRRAMRDAASGIPADLFLVDAVTNLSLPGREKAILHGDAISYSIAAASIIAKVTRDRQMRSLDRVYPAYGFAKHKGYGTAEHIDMLKRYGPCPEHRRTFIGHFWQKE